MSKVKFHIQLKGYVGGYDFDRTDVDRVLTDNASGPVNVLIDSLGGSLATGLSISAAFKNHGDVHVHFVSLNASAATIASLGAAHISMDAGAMYLVHKCSVGFFEWGSMNSDQFAQLIADCEKTREDLNALDLNVARLYAARCKKPVDKILALMERGGWLSPQQALEWGFIDEITDYKEDKAAKLTDAVASAMAYAGIPIPNIPLNEEEPSGSFAKFLSSLASFFRTPTNSINKYMDKTYNFLCKLLACNSITLTEGAASLQEAQLTAIENELAAKDARCSELEAQLKDKDTEIADLKAKLKDKPGASSTQVVEDKKEDKPKNRFSEYLDTAASASNLYNSIP